jgi:hypothetical protein
MFDAIKLALLVMQFIDKLFDKWRDKGLIDQGYDKAIAEVTQSIFAKTEAGKRIMEKVNAMPIEDVDKGLIDLEPK